MPRQALDRLGWEKVIVCGVACRAQFEARHQIACWANPACRMINL
jgi:hypothetical protein